MSSSLASLRLPSWYLALVLAVLVTAHTQVTLRHLALRVAGVHTGKVDDVHATADGGQLRCTDSFAIYRPGELDGQSVWFHGVAYPVAANTRTTFVLTVPQAAEVAATLLEHPEYSTGHAPRGLLARLALKLPAANFTLADLLLGLAALLGVALVAVHAWGERSRSYVGADAPPRLWRRLLAATPWAGLLLVLIGALSLVDRARVGDDSFTAADWHVGAKKLVQWVELFIVAAVVFRAAAGDARWRQWAWYALVLLAGAQAVAALGEYAAVLGHRTPRGLVDIGGIDGLWGFPYNPGRSGEQAGSEASRSVLSLYWVVLVPWLLAQTRAAVGWGWRVLAGVLAAAGLVATLSLVHLVAALAGCLAVALWWRRSWAVPVVLLGALVVVGGACSVIPQHARILLDSAALYRSADPYGTLPMPLTGQDAKTVPDWQPWQQKYVELQAGLNAVSFSPWMGLGLGHYQMRINTFYTNSRDPHLWVAKQARNYMEKDAQSQYLVVAVETGLLGVGALLLLLALALRGTDIAARAGEPATRAWAIGVSGALVALLLAGTLAPFLMRGIGLFVALLLGLAAALGATSIREAAVRR